jgi:hypothetical protein
MLDIVHDDRLFAPGWHEDLNGFIVIADGTDLTQRCRRSSLRPTVSKREPSSSGPKKLPGQQKQIKPHPFGGDMTKGKYQAEGEEARARRS